MNFYEEFQYLTGFLTGTIAIIALGIQVTAKEIIGAYHIICTADASVLGRKFNLRRELASIKFYKTETSVFAGAPANPGDVGIDLAADLGGEGNYVTLNWGEPPVMIGTGVSIELQDGIEATIRPRSSLNLKGIHLGFGTIDSSYRGELKINLLPLGPFADGYKVSHGDRIGQLVISKFVTPYFEEVEDVAELSVTARGTGGYGSTGV